MNEHLHVKINEALMALILDWRYDRSYFENLSQQIYLGQNGDSQIHGFELVFLFWTLHEKSV